LPVKDNVHHVQPPVSVLNTMLTFRLHLDATNENNGCLKVVPGSHHYGILNQSEITQIVKESVVVSCVAKAGDAIIMRPHILHSSSKSMETRHRRVVHLQFSNFTLPANICWA